MIYNTDFMRVDYKSTVINMIVYLIVRDISNSQIKCHLEKFIAANVTKKCGTLI